MKMSKIDVFGHYRRISHLESIQSVLAWDSEVTLPVDSLSIRQTQIESLNSEIHRLSSDREFINAVTEYSAKNDDQSHQLRNLKRFCYRKAATDAQLDKEITRYELLATENWKTAKKESNFSLIKNDLEHLIKLRKSRAEQIKSFEPYRSEMKDLSVYDVMIDGYEPGLRNKDIASIFSPLKDNLVKKIKTLSYKNNANNAVLDKKVEDSFIRDLIQKFGFDLSKGRLDFTKSYPFCGGWQGDVRITTQENAAWVDNLLMTLHEMGHGIYQQSLPERYRFTPSGFGASTGFHESQSRFYENQIGRSPAFIKYISNLCKLPYESLSAQIQFLKKSPIRTQADEVAYNLHIILRWEIEQDLIDGKMSVSDIPEVWNDKMFDYFGVKIQKDSEGCLQDLHWFMSDFGWFNSYCLGNLIAAQFFDLFSKQFSNWENQISSGDFLFVKDFLGQLHNLAATENFNGTCLKVFGEPLSEEYFLNYIDQRYF